ncbi:MAG: flagellar hook-associated protein FlgL [Deltaproteobacteria bacterium]|nr:flagellar hook-associated protein FlgL [Deltaproteobacteria bacterium]MBW2129661.1 flagellar hook-associated protein FlgL [Deltaproteobacteria bacterium]MBW2302811.1 flagellar hook-associated protein FlgL [Deltaproteobacteria bacterium]
MRIANKTLYDNIVSNLSKTSTEMLRANQVVSSGKRINRLSDDPVGLVAVLDLRSSQAHVEQLERNINMGKSWLNMGESALTQIEDLLSQTKALCVQMANGTQDATQRRNAATVVDGRLRQIISLANTQVNGRYIFGGTRTDTQPFVFNEGASPPNVSYQGNDTAFSVKIGKNTTVEVGRDGETIFGDDGIDWSDPTDGEDNIFKTLLDLKDALTGNDVSAIQGAISKIDNHLATVRTMISNTGARTIRLEAKENIIQDLKVTYSDRKSKLEDADLAKAIMDLKSKETAYQAALASSARVMNLSLVNYI